MYVLFLGSFYVMYLLVLNMCNQMRNRTSLLQTLQLIAIIFVHIQIIEHIFTEHEICSVRVCMLFMYPRNLFTTRHH